MTPVNDAPSFIKGADQTVNEDAGAQSVTGWATAISAGPANESSQTVSFQVTGNTNPGLFSAAPAVAPDGTLTYTPAADAFGSATITIQAQDNGGTADGGVDTSGAADVRAQRHRRQRHADLHEGGGSRPCSRIRARRPWSTGRRT